MITFLSLIGVAVLLLCACIPYWHAQAQAQAQAQAAQVKRDDEQRRQAVELSPSYQQAQAQAQSHSLALDKMQLDREKIQLDREKIQIEWAKVQHQQWLAMHIIAPDTYRVIEGTVQAFPSLKPAMLTEKKEGQPKENTMPIIVPAKYDLLSIWQDFTPSLEQIFLGMTAHGPIYVPLRMLWHIALTGPTGGGKTSILRKLLMQLAYLQCHLTLCDIHYAPIKEDGNGKPIDWRPIEKRLAQPPIRDIDTIAEWMEWLAFGELQARIDRQYRGEKVGRPLFFTIEELPAVLDEAGDRVSQPLAKILRQGRQYSICFVGASQDLLTKTLNMSQGPRECFRTGYYTGGDPHTAKALLDLRNGEKIDEEGIGIDGLVYLKTAMHQAVQTRVGWASNEALYELLDVPADEQIGRPGRERPTVIDADLPDFEAFSRRPTNVRDFPQSTVVTPVEQSDATSQNGPERPKEYRLSDVEIEQFIAAYKACNNIDKSLSAVGRGGRYKKHASEIVRVNELRKEA